jgi:hypothetical protein
LQQKKGTWSDFPAPYCLKGKNSEKFYVKSVVFEFIDSNPYIPSVRKPRVIQEKKPTTFTINDFSAQFKMNLNFLRNMQVRACND